MQDRFKFRVWDKEFERMLYPEGEEEGIDFDGNGNLVGIDKIGLWNGGLNCIPMQCTGLKDKNGKLIYEGDYLGGIWDGYIGYCDCCKCFSLFIDDDCMACQGDVSWYELVEEDNKLEVIGNIWESPELVTW